VSHERGIPPRKCFGRAEGLSANFAAEIQRWHGLTGVPPTKARFARAKCSRQCAQLNAACVPAFRGIVSRLIPTADFFTLVAPVFLARRRKGG
jgi:hypothetical protein